MFVRGNRVATVSPIYSREALKENRAIVSKLNSHGKRGASNPPRRSTKSLAVISAWDETNSNARHPLPVTTGNRGQTTFFAARALERPARAAKMKKSTLSGGPMHPTSIHLPEMGVCPRFSPFRASFRG